MKDPLDYSAGMPMSVSPFPCPVDELLNPGYVTGSF